jgi:hypothetical protein
MFLLTQVKEKIMERVEKLRPFYFKHILLFNKKQLDRTQVSQLRNVFSNTYINEYKMNTVLTSI